MICKQLQHCCLGDSDKEKHLHMLSTDVTISEYFHLSLADVNLTGVEGWLEHTAVTSPLLNDCGRSIVLMVSKHPVTISVNAPWGQHLETMDGLSADCRFQSRLSTQHLESVGSMLPSCAVTHLPQGCSGDRYPHLQPRAE